jgi:hypothetical protein
MKASTPWITYRTRFLVKGKQLTTSLTFTDLLGRQHSGRKGDYLVESSDGVLSIAPKRIFEDIYVPVLAGETVGPEQMTDQRRPPKRVGLQRYVPASYQGTTSVVPLASPNPSRL